MRKLIHDIHSPASLALIVVPTGLVTRVAPTRLVTRVVVVVVPTRLVALLTFATFSLFLLLPRGFVLTRALWRLASWRRLTK